MNGLRTAVEDATATELDRLGSEKLLIALTEATLEESAVRAAVAAGEREAAAAFRAWATAGDAVGEAFEDAAVAAEERAERLGERDAPADALFPLDPEAFGETAERVGAGLLGWPLIQARVHRGAISFFINEADEAAADAFREARAAVEVLPDEGEQLLEAHGADRERARAAAEAVVDEAYESYAGALEALGIDPRPIC